MSAAGWKTTIEFFDLSGKHLTVSDRHVFAQTEDDARREASLQAKEFVSFFRSGVPIPIGRWEITRIEQLKSD